MKLLEEVILILNIHILTEMTDPFHPWCFRTCSTTCFTMKFMKIRFYLNNINFFLWNIKTKIHTLSQTFTVILLGDIATMVMVECWQTTHRFCEAVNCPLITWCRVLGGRDRRSNGNNINLSVFGFLVQAQRATEINNNKKTIK